MGTRFNMIGLFVQDLQKMVAFYRNVLGFEIEWDGRGPYAEFTSWNTILDVRKVRIA